jgi:hypothetical protein
MRITRDEDGDVSGVGSIAKSQVEEGRKESPTGEWNHQASSQHALSLSNVCSD